MTKPNPRLLSTVTIKKLTDLVGSDTSTNHNARRILARVQEIDRGLEALSKLNRSPLPSDTPEAHAKRILDAQKKLEGKLQAASASLGEIVETASGDYQRGADAKANIRTNHLASEIRQAFRAMDESERAAALSNVVQGLDGPTVAALAESPQFLHGTNPKAVERAVKDLRKTADPEGHHEYQTFLAVAEGGVKTLSWLDQAAREYADPGKLADLEQRESNAKEAQGNFQEALSAQGIN